MQYCNSLLRNLSASHTLLLVLFWLLTLCEKSSEYSVQLGLKWGDKCKIPGPNDFLRPNEECEMSKGLQCQSYQQGDLCGCLIRSSLSFDEHSGECRRKPGQHCPYFNTTENPRAYEGLGYNFKCHTRAECVIVEPIPEAKKSKKGKQEQFAVCRCKPGYKLNREGLACHGVNFGDKCSPTSIVYTIAIPCLTFVFVTFMFSPTQSFILT